MEKTSDKELTHTINQKLNLGMSKSEIFQELKPEHEEENLRKILATRPAPELREKYRGLHMALCGIWIVFIGLEALGLVEIIINMDLIYILTFLISILFTVQIWKFNGHYFLPGAIWLSIGIFNILKEFLGTYELDPDYELLKIVSLSISLILLTGVVLLLIIRKKVFSYYKWFKPEVNFKNEIVFENYYSRN